jgi:hypothetical protein
VRTSTRIGIVGSSVVAAGGAAFGAVAPAAYAAPSATSYHATASSSSGDVTIGNQKIQLEKTAAYPGHSPEHGSIGTAQLIPVLQGVPGIGPALVKAIQTANPSGLDVVTVSADANASGNSSACAAVLAADCTSSSHPLKLDLGLADLGITTLTGALSSVTGVALQITLNGPTATCTESANGQGTANDSPVDATAQLVDSTGQPLAQTPPIQLHGGDILSQLGGLGLPSTGASLGLILNGGSKSVSNGKATATALEVGLTSGGSTLLDVKGATVTCGPNGASNGGGGGGTGGGGTGGNGGGTGGLGTGTGPTTNGEAPLTGIGTDEGRSTAPAQPWNALAGMP